MFEAKRGNKNAPVTGKTNRGKTDWGETDRGKTDKKMKKRQS
jgi:hypothetical protein